MSQLPNGFTETNRRENRVDSMVTQLTEYGLSRPCHFNVLINPPELLRESFPQVTNRLRLYCQKAVLPGRSILTNPIRTNGPIIMNPYISTYNEMPMEIRVSRNGFERKFLDSWMEIVHSQKTQKLGWRDDFARQITVDQLNPEEDGSPSMSYVLEHAFPIALGDMTLSSDDINTYHTMNVTFIYEQWRIL